MVKVDPKVNLVVFPVNKSSCLGYMVWTPARTTIKTTSSRVFMSHLVKNIDPISLYCFETQNNSISAGVNYSVQSNTNPPTHTYPHTHTHMIRLRNSLGSKQKISEE